MVVRLLYMKPIKPLVQTNLLKRQLQGMLRHLMLSDYDLSVTLTDNKRQRQYNKQFRNKDKPTDVISVQFSSFKLKPGHPPPMEFGIHELGSLFLSVPYIQQQIAEGKLTGCTLDERITFLCAHGILHLVGYTHDEDSDWEVMKKKEQELLAAIRYIPP
eukprot:gb/GEZN01017167.1/.p1 GENE.gb/GEZN01017167.1/~~gb/GEZN01017167.1/.p1  ORF type:complete len:159 (+),score=23.05 gb/GEZN01017167.1/:114-590(+)